MLCELMWTSNVKPYISNFYIQLLKLYSPVSWTEKGKKLTFFFTLPTLSPLGWLKFYHACGLHQDRAWWDQTPSSSLVSLSLWFIWLFIMRFFFSYYVPLFYSLHLMLYFVEEYMVFWGSNRCRSRSLNMTEGGYVTPLAAVRCISAKFTTDYTGALKKWFVTDIRLN